MDQSTLGLDPLPRKTREEVFLDEMNQVVPWAELVALIQPHARGAHQALGGRPPFARAGPTGERRRRRSPASVCGTHTRRDDLTLAWNEGCEAD